MGCIVTIGIASIYSFTSKETKSQKTQWYKIRISEIGRGEGGSHVRVQPIDGVSKERMDRDHNTTLSLTNTHKFGDGSIEEGTIYIQANEYY